MTIAIVGAGMAGLSCATFLQESGQKVQLFDKGRGPGGRMSTRRMETPVGEVSWDHGAQYFTARDPDFIKTVRAWEAEGAVSEWSGKFLALGQTPDIGTREDARFVGKPGMNGLIKHMSKDLDIQWTKRVSKIEGDTGSWSLHFEDGDVLSEFRHVVVAIPPEQAADLFRPIVPKLTAQAEAAKSAPCWAVLLAYDTPLNAGFDAAKITNAPLSWIARNSSKPGRADHEAWVLHASPDWSREHVDEHKDEVTAKLVRNFRAMSGAPEPIFAAAHRWLYALADKTVTTANFGWDSYFEIGACGDWYIAPRIEAAWQSGRLLAKNIVEST